MSVQEEPLAASHAAEARRHRYLVYEDVVDAFEGVTRLTTERAHRDAHERRLLRCIHKTPPYLPVILSRNLALSTNPTHIDL